MSRRLSCRDFVHFLADYLAGELHAEQLAVFNEHLARCPPCVSYVRTYRQAVELGRAAVLGHGELAPADAPEDLIRAVLGARAAAALTPARRRQPMR